MGRQDAIPAGRNFTSVLLLRRFQHGRFLLPSHHRLFRHAEIIPTFDGRFTFLLFFVFFVVSQLHERYRTKRTLSGCPDRVPIRCFPSAVRPVLHALYSDRHSVVFFFTSTSSITTTTSRIITPPLGLLIVGTGVRGILEEPA